MSDEYRTIDIPCLDCETPITYPDTITQDQLKIARWLLTERACPNCLAVWTIKRLLRTKDGKIRMVKI